MASGVLAEEFVASKTGKLKGKALSTQEFKTGTGATVECTEVSSTGTYAGNDQIELEGGTIEVT